MRGRTTRSLGKSEITDARSHPNRIRVASFCASRPLKPGFFRYGACSESSGQKPGFSELPDHAQTTRTKNRLRTSDRSARNHQRRGGTRCEKSPASREAACCRARPGRSRALPKPGFFGYGACSESSGQKPGFSELPDHAQNHTHQESPANVPPQRQKPSTPRWYPLRKKPGFARGSVLPGTTGKKPGFAEARLLRLWSMFRIVRPKAGILRAARPRYTEPQRTKNRLRTSAAARPETINAAVVPAAKKARLRARQRVAGHDREEAGLCRSPAFSVTEHVQNRQAKSRDSPSCQTTLKSPHQRDCACERHADATINAAVVPAARKARLRAGSVLPGTTGKKPGFAEARLLPLRSMFRIVRLKRCLEKNRPRVLC